MILRSIAAFLLVLFASAKAEVSKSVILTLGDYLPEYDACIDKEGGVVVSSSSTIYYKDFDGPFVSRAVVGYPVAVPGDPTGSTQILSIPADIKPVRAVMAGRIAFLA